ncbi:hypothetical protein [Sagittula stellata]|uniref:Uncharacterized protein n=1 Tax=Sagittula stellata (strain ATCC 700073 / DSM 11524 / E-37) TaxID=388399 RepID=A3KA55_SAGS3|nr:hypothetical protein [Sagittula stellata]EBA05998.1 hypothetical protein SSE37_25358 [Sagittula stellata E-37]
MKQVRFVAGWLMYQPGETAGFPAGEADQLIKRGVAVPLSRPKAASVAAPAPVSPAPDPQRPTDPGAAEQVADQSGMSEREALIAGIIGKLDPSSDFTASGKPEVGAINAMLSDQVEPVSASERDAVWQMVKAPD